MRVARHTSTDFQFHSGIFCQHTLLDVLEIMANIESIVRIINKELVPQFEEKLRSYLIQQNKEWLIEQIVRLTLDAHSLRGMDRKLIQETKAKKRVERIARLQKMGLNRDKLVEFIDNYADYDRTKLIEQNYLLANAPAKGTALITDAYRTKKGKKLLLYCQDILFGILFGDVGTKTDLPRTGRELFSLTVPRYKADVLDFMKATTEFKALGSWQDPESVSNDSREDNIILEVEYSEVEGELGGAGLIRALSLINNLEVNEQILYARIIVVEHTTLIT
ncbi:MAG: hypothetical protein ACRC62_16810 [Microcoleus sp.]